MDTSICAKLSPKEFKLIGKSSNPYYCTKCIAETLPFSEVSDEDIMCMSVGLTENLFELYSKCLEIESAVEYDKYFEDIDPDENFISRAGQNYLTADQ